MATAEWLPPKATWLAHHEPQVIGEFVDWIGFFHLTDRRTTSLNHASYSDGGWPEDHYDHFGIHDAIERLHREIVPIGAFRGGLTEASASHLGLRTGTPVAQYGADTFVAMAGLRVTGPGRIRVITGSSHLQLVQALADVAPEPGSAARDFRRRLNAVLAS